MELTPVTSKLYQIAVRQGERILLSGDVRRCFVSKNGEKIIQRVSPKGGWQTRVFQNGVLVKIMQKTMYRDLGYHIDTWDYVSKTGKQISVFNYNKKACLRRVFNKVDSNTPSLKGRITWLRKGVKTMPGHILDIKRGPFGLSFAKMPNVNVSCNFFSLDFLKAFSKIRRLPADMPAGSSNLL